jgi:hypothetical protein
VTRVGAGTEFVVVVNVDTSWLCRDVLDGVDHPIGRVAWGAGKAFTSSVLSLAGDAEPPARMWYWGDADPEGVNIATSAAAVAESAGLPPVEPHPGLSAAFERVPLQGRGRYR